MRVEFSKSAVKFLKRLDVDKQRLIKAKILLLRRSLNERGVLPFDALDIKKMKGSWQGYYRVRVGKIRIIFVFWMKEEKLFVQDICFRGDAYR